MAYLNTYNDDNELTLKVFPSTRRVRVQQDSRETSEETVTGVIRHFADYDGFAVTKVVDANGPFKFNIHGYYFEVGKTQDIFDLVGGGATQIWASIVIDNTNPAYPELWGQDAPDALDPDTLKYLGVNFTTSEVLTDIHGEVHSVQLFSRTSSSASWSIINTQKFGPKSVDVIDGIDGGTF